MDNVPIIQSARLEDYSPELWALTGDKGAAVLNMLRYTLGDDKFLRGRSRQFAAAVRLEIGQHRRFPQGGGDGVRQELGYFFIQWIESSGAPEFKLEYTIFRTRREGASA